MEWLERLWLILQLIVLTYGRDIYISHLHGLQEEQCEGNVTHPCYDFKYVYYGKLKTMNFYLHGEKKQKYVLDQNARLRGNITIQSYRDNNNKSIIVMNAVDFSNVTQLTFKNLIINTNVSFAKHYLREIKFEHCQVNCSFLSIFRSRFNSNRLMINILDSVMIKTCVKITGGDIEVNVTDTEFKDNLYSRRNVIEVVGQHPLYYPTVTFNNCAFTNINVLQILHAVMASIRIYSTTVSGNTIGFDKDFYESSAISIHYSLLKISNSTFINNKVTHSAFLYAKYATVNIESSSFKKNIYNAPIVISDFMSELMILSSKLTLTDSNFRHINGRLALLSLRYSSVQINRCNFKNNTATSIILIDKLQLSDLSNIEFSNNTVGNQLINVDNCNNVTFEHLKVEKNLYTNFLFSKTSSFTLKDSLLQNNKANSVDLIAKEFMNILISNVTFKKFGIVPPLGGSNIADLDGKTLSLKDVHFDLYNYHQNVFKIYYHEDKAKNVQVSCSQGANPKCKIVGPQGPNSKTVIDYRQRNLLTCFCEPCKTTTYSVQRGSITLSLNLTLSLHYKQDQTVKCLKCPVGGFCDNGLTVSKGNTIGQKINNLIEYTTCPEGYCCPSNCTSYKQCASGRKGPICGECDEGYQIDLHSTRCIKKEKCKKPFIFWSLFFLLPLMFVVIVFMYIDVIMEKLKELPRHLAKIIECIKSKEEHPSIVYNNQEANQQNERSISQVAISDENQVDTSEVLTSRQQLPTTSVTDNNIRTVLDEPDDTTKIFTYSGIFNILVSFFQIKSLLAVKEPFTPSYLTQMSDIISSIFNANFPNMTSYICIELDMTTVSKYFLKNFLFNILMPLYVLFLICVYRLLKPLLRTTHNTLRNALKYGVHQPTFIRNNNYRFIHRLCITYIKTLMFIYKNIAFFAVSMIYCIDMENKCVLFIQGDVECYQSWQYAVMILIAFWVVPFPICLWIAYRMFKGRLITNQELIICLSMPICLPFYFISRRYFNTRQPAVVHKVQHQMLDQLFTEPYRLKKGSNDQYLFWEHWKLIQRLILAVVVTFFSNPLHRVILLTPCILIFSSIYHICTPYKDSLKLLHWMELVSMVGFSFLLVKNIFNAFLYTYEIYADEGEITGFIVIFTCLEWIFNPLTFIAFYFIVLPRYYKLQTLIKRKFT